jgi:DNA-binding FrmR family transcriptional regulator
MFKAPLSGGIGDRSRYPQGYQEALGDNTRRGIVVALPKEVIVEFSNDVIADLQRRLRRVEGQVRGVQTMLDEGRECRDVVTQVAAATKALEQVGFKLLAAGLTSCLEDPARAEAEGYPIAEVERLFLKLA